MTSVAARKWRVRLSSVAELDFANILLWTNENFGAKQTSIYRDTLVRAIGELGDGPDAPGSRVRNDIIPGLRMLHVARHGRRGRHFLLYRVAQGRVTEIGRILHDQMDFQRHLESSTDEGEQ